MEPQRGRLEVTRIDKFFDDTSSNLLELLKKIPKSILMQPLKKNPFHINPVESIIFLLMIEILTHLTIKIYFEDNFKIFKHSTQKKIKLIEKSFSDEKKIKF
jgi:hypothetical protein